jgi:hypothetical protein
MTLPREIPKTLGKQGTQPSGSKAQILRFSVATSIVNGLEEAAQPKIVKTTSRKPEENHPQFGKTAANGLIF